VQEQRQPALEPPVARLGQGIFPSMPQAPVNWGLLCGRGDLNPHGVATNRT
jgi:hypothetical protein